MILHAVYATAHDADLTTVLREVGSILYRVKKNAFVSLYETDSELTDSAVSYR